MLLGLNVPICRSSRGLCRASELEEFSQRCRSFAMDLDSEDAEAWIVAETYRQRSQIEQFLWWQKKIVNACH